MTQAAATPEIIGRRYRLIDKLGEGGMGAVYRVADRLTGQIVALKRLHIATENLAFHSRPPKTPHSTNDATAMRVALAREFQVLSSLRHPRIISVLDYGFEDANTSDAESAPYFTMTLLEGAKPLSVAAVRRDGRGKIELILQVLQALVYLHRRGVIHRDLKPGNALVTAEGVKVLDFGLAIEGRDNADEIAGTPRYWSPEILRGAGAAVASDLYAVGVIAYEMFAGKPIFDDSNLQQLAQSILTRAPDLDVLPSALALPIGTLLAKDPTARYASADETIAELCAVLHIPAPSEPTTIRESFLQAATFVGRASEMRTLKRALYEAESGRGSAWLIGGESGVGKSRLINELRTVALVSGSTVVRGQLIAEAGLPFHGWRDPARRLALDADLTDTEAGVLKTLVPDIEALLGRPVPDVPSVGIGADIVRFAETMVGICRRPRAHPLVIFMEDIHWVDESIIVLGELSDVLKREALSVLIVATFRDDERPDIFDMLHAMQPLRLRRLEADGIAQLSASMLGENHLTSDLLDLLERETEGNIFFLIETIRALAETAGGLNAIGQVSLSESIFADGGHAPGMFAILRRRLERAPADAQAWLKLAAVAGRQIDAALMRHFGLVDLDAWLTVCADVAILDITDGAWRFSHDKLRDAVLTDLTTDERPALHRRVAVGLEALYPAQEAYAQRRMEHWHAAGDAWKEANAALDTVDYWHTLGKYHEIKTLCADVLARLPAPDTDDQRRLRAQINLYQGYADEPLGNYAESSATIRESLAVFTAINDLSKMASCYNALGALADQQGDGAAALDYFIKGVEIRRQEDYPLGLAVALGNLALYYDLNEDTPHAIQYYGESEAICAAHNLRDQLVFNQVNRGALHLQTSDLDAAHADLTRGIELAREIGLERGVGAGLVSMAEWALARGEWWAAQNHADESLTINMRIGDQQSIIESLITLARIAERRGDLEIGLAHAEHAAALARALPSPRQAAAARIAAGFLALAQCDVGRAVPYPDMAAAPSIEQPLATARLAFREALGLAQTVRSPMMVLTALSGFARLRLLNDDVNGCRVLLERSAAHPNAAARTVRERTELIRLLLTDMNADQTPIAPVDEAAVDFAALRALSV